MVQSSNWQWETQSPAYGNFGNANQWTVNAGLVSLARESAQNTNDARLGAERLKVGHLWLSLT
jgi:hypothetical protein